MSRTAWLYSAFLFGSLCGEKRELNGSSWQFLKHNWGFKYTKYTSICTDSDCCAFAPKILVSFPRIPFPETIKWRIRGFPARKNSCVNMKTRVAKHCGRKRAGHCGLITNRCSQDFSCVRNMNCMSATTWTVQIVQILLNEIILQDFPTGRRLSSWLTLSHLRVINVPCGLTRNIISHSMKNLAFHSLLRWKMIILSILAT